MARVPSVLVTRHVLDPLGALLEDRGLQPVHVPLAELVPTGAAPPRGAPALALISSATTLTLCPDVAAQLAAAQVVAVGPSTAAAVRARGLSLAAVGTSDAQEAVAALARIAVRSAGPVWIVGTERPSHSLQDALVAWGHPVVHWQVYRRQVPAGAGAALHAAGPMEGALFTAASAVDTWVSSAPPPIDVVVAIGKSTAAALQRHGVSVAGVPERPGLAAAADVMQRLLGRG